MRDETRNELLERMSQARAETDRIFALVHPDSFYERPIPERHRIIFYLGHLEAFDWNLLRPRLFGAKSFDPSLDRLFAFGIDPVGGGLPSDRPGDWPRESQVRLYQSDVRSALDGALAGPWDWDGEERPETLLNVAIEHRLMHAET
ncbi:MAG: SUMF1/EgtB/PvdO family nonheme iron enzyme, partial [Bryobacteraceae bacterium]